MMRQGLAVLIRRYGRRLGNVVMAERYKFACAQAKNELRTYLPTVYAALERQRQAGGLSHDYSEFKLLELALWLERNQPKTIIELGSGATSAVFGNYAARTPGVRVLSVDESPDYSSRARGYLDPVAAAAVEFQHVERVVEERAGVEVCRYREHFLDSFAGAPIDLVYVDGPSNRSPRDPTRLIPCVDSVRMLEMGHSVGHFLFDYRLSSVAYLCADPCGLAYDRHLHHLAIPAGEPWVIGPVRHHSWFQRRGTGTVRRIDGCAPEPGR